MTADSVGHMAKIVVMHIQMVNRISVSTMGVIGSLRGSLVRIRLMMVTPAISAANGKSKAKPQLRRCGFMTLIQTHMRMPMNGRLKIKGREPSTISVITTSLMTLLSGKLGRRSRGQGIEIF